MEITQYIKKNSLKKHQKLVLDTIKINLLNQNQMGILEM